MDIPVGTVFENVTVIGTGSRSFDGHARVQCRCSCGHEWPVRHRSLVDGGTTQCRYCKRRKPPGTTHGRKFTPEYNAWQLMKDRCLNPNNNYYQNYGGRGISVCQRWAGSFPNFLEDVGNRPSDRYSLDRVDVNGNYEPGNVRWATRAEQAVNKRNNVRMKVGDENLTVAEWCRSLSVAAATIYRHLNAGRDMEWIVTRYRDPEYAPNCRKHLFTHDGETKNMSQWARVLGISPGLLRHHLIVKRRSLEWVIASFT